MAGVKRGPKFPFIDLEKATERAQALYKKEDRNPVPAMVAAAAWGYRPKTSGGIQTVAALKGYGLLQDEGRAQKRTVRLTKLALRIILNAPDRKEAIREAALTPKLFEELWSKWKEGERLPSPATMKHHLVFDMDFSEKSASDFVRIFTSTILFADLRGSDRMVEAEQEFEEIAVGDYIQWESQGTLQFPEPRQVTGFADDGDFLFVEGNQTGIPVNEAIKTKAPEPSPLDARHIQTRQRRPGMQQATMPLSEGDATLEWPTILSPESFEDFETWVQLMLRRAKRSIKESDENGGGEPD